MCGGNIGRERSILGGGSDVYEAGLVIASDVKKSSTFTKELEPTWADSWGNWRLSRVGLITELCRGAFLD